MYIYSQGKKGNKQQIIQKNYLNIIICLVRLRVNCLVNQETHSLYE